MRTGEAEVIPLHVPPDWVRVVTAASLFDGHDAAINIMRRILQSQGAEVVHLGHDRSVDEIVDAAVQEDAHAVAVSSYQGGHMEYFKYLVDRLRERGAAHVRVYGGGGGTILPEEIEELHAYGVARIFSPQDGRRMGLEGMIRTIVDECNRRTIERVGNEVERLSPSDPVAVARLITWLEANQQPDDSALKSLRGRLDAAAGAERAPVVGLTGTGGAGKSSVVDELVRRFRLDFPEVAIGILLVDPTRRRSRGALLGDRIRLNSINDPRIYARSLATRQTNRAISGAVRDAIRVLQAAKFDLVLVETAGIGQSDSSIVDLVDVPLYVMTPEYGAPSQLEKIDMIDLAELVILNKADRRGAKDALRDVRKQWRRNRSKLNLAEADTPVVATIASQWDDPGMDQAYERLRALVVEAGGRKFDRDQRKHADGGGTIPTLIDPARVRYLAEIAESVRAYRRTSERLAERAADAGAIARTIADIGDAAPEVAKTLAERRDKALADLDPAIRKALDAWPETRARYEAEEQSYQVRDKTIRVQNHKETLSHSKIPKVALPRSEGLGRAHALLSRGEPARILPVHRRDLSVQARGRGSGPHVRGRRPSGAHEPALPLRLQRTAGDPALDRVRQRDALRPEPRPSSRHLRQGRELGSLGLHGRRREEALLGLRPLRAFDVGFDDDQRPGADDSRVLLERRDRPTSRAPPAGDRHARRGAEALRGRRPAALLGRASRGPRRRRAFAARHPGRRDRSTATRIRRSRLGSSRRSAARCRPTSSRRTRPRTPASSRPDSRSR